jgi:hypothetical protein
VNCAEDLHQCRVVTVMLTCCSIRTLAQAPFKPAEVTSARDIAYPLQKVLRAVLPFSMSPSTEWCDRSKPCRALHSVFNFAGEIIDSTLEVQCGLKAREARAIRHQGCNRFPVTGGFGGGPGLQTHTLRGGTRIEQIRAILGNRAGPPPLIQFALNATNQWCFQMATLDEKPVTSALVIAFVFAPLPPSK